MRLAQLVKFKVEINMAEIYLRLRIRTGMRRKDIWRNKAKPDDCVSYKESMLDFVGLITQRQI
jgi:hypothetical protein